VSSTRRLARFLKLLRTVFDSEGARFPALPDLDGWRAEQKLFDCREEGAYD
jgi:hypothetical protein